MRLSISTYVYVEREEGRSVYVCQPLRGPQITTRDALLGTALSKLGNKMRKTINEWIQDGKANRVSPWLYDPDMQARVEKLTLVLRDRTLRWKVLLVSVPSFDRYIAFSPSIPDLVFDLASPGDLEARAIEVYTDWAQSRLSDDEHLVSSIGTGSEMWSEPIEVDVESSVRNKKKSDNILASLFGDSKMHGAEELHKVGTCLDELAADFEPAIGRRVLVEEVDRMLQRDDRQGVLVVGPTSAGKTAIVRECAKKRANRYRKKRGHKPQMWWLSPQRLISGMCYLGQWEQRWLAILREATKRDHILYFDDLVGLFTAGRTRDSSLSAADVLRGYLSEHQVRILAETTDEQLALLRRRDRALADQFHLVHVPAMASEDALPIVLQSTSHIEAQTERFFHPETIPLIMRHQEIFAPDLAFPGKAIEMTKTLAKHATDVVDRSIFYRLAGNQVGANLMLLVGRLGDQEAIGKALGEQLIGQPDAVQALSRIVVRFAQHLQPTDRPLGVLLFLGPTGVGKTESAKALTRLLYCDESHLVRLDMNEMTTPHAAEQLVGTFDQPEGRLTSAVRRQPNCVILLDEIEKAHPDVFDYLLQVIGEGRLTDARGRVADFRSSIILLTSNLGSSEQSSSLGFETSSDRRKQIYKRAAQSFFRPEFFNRLDDVVAFRSLDADDMQKIVRIQMNDVLSRDGLQRRDVFVNVTESAVKRIIRTGFDAQLGARAVRRMLEREIISPLGDCLSGLNIDHPALVHISDSENQPNVSCTVTPLAVCTPSKSGRLSELEEVVEAGQLVFERLESALSGMTDELRAADEQYGEKTHNASYYALREHVHRCSDLLKAGKARLRQQTEPRMGLNASPSLRRRSLDSGSRRQMLDYQAQEDVRSAIQDGSSDALEKNETRQLARRIVDSLSTAQSLIDHASTPRSWLIGFTNITESSLELQQENRVKRLLGPDYEIYTQSGGIHDFLSRLINCLRQVWQYEVASEETHDNFWHVSGISLLGILKPLLGTYRTEQAGKPAHLCVLRAIPTEFLPGENQSSSGRALELENTNTKNNHAKNNEPSYELRTDQHELRTPANQPMATNTIRGLIGEKAVDFVSGAKLDLSSDDWSRSEKSLLRVIDFWTECLPVPKELVCAETEATDLPIEDS